MGTARFRRHPPRPRLMRVYVDVMMPDATTAKPTRTARRFPLRRAVRGRARLRSAH
jgi:hypothetical protein